MKILFAGSSHHGSSLKSDIQEAAVQLGKAAAERGHTILIESDSKRTVDPYVAQGALEAGIKYPLEPLVELHRMEERGWDGIDLNPNTVQVVWYKRPPNPDKERLGARAGGLNACDVAILVGGVGGTVEIGDLAGALGKPVLPIASFGGAAADIYQEVKAQLKLNPTVHGSLHTLIDPWGGAETAERVLVMAEALVDSHTYFLSYSHQQQAEADHVEILLRRRGRQILRDETERKPGEKVSEALFKMIARTDTFAQLWSAEAESSEWCTEEREHAAQLHKSGGKPRMIALTLDRAPLPNEFNGHFSQPADSRESRRASITEIVENE